MPPTFTYDNSGPSSLAGDSNNPFDLSGGCTLDGLPFPCDWAMQLVNGGAASVQSFTSPMGPLGILQGLGGTLVPDYNDSSHDRGDEATGTVYGYIGMRFVPSGGQRRASRGAQQRTPATPQNTLPTYQEVSKLKPTPEQQRCSDYLAKFFGGKGAEAGANGFTPSGAYRGAYTYNGKRISGHLSDYAIHISGSKDQTQDTDIFVPLGGKHTLSTSDPDGNTVDLFYYKNLNSLGAYTIAVLHLDRSPHKPDGGRLHIGRTGGPGGDGRNDRHVHIELLKGEWNTFPKPSIRGSSQTNLSMLCPRN